MESIVFRWHRQADHEQAIEWLLVNHEGKAPGSVRSGSLNDLARQLNSQTQKRPGTLLLSADYYSVHRVSLPPKLSPANARKAAPFALEEELADSLDNYHFAYGDVEKQDDATLLELAVINKQQLDTLLQELSSHRITPKYIYPESLLLPDNGDTVNVFVENDVLFARMQNNTPVVLPLNLLDNVLDEFSTEQTIKIFSPNDLSATYTDKDLSWQQFDGSLFSILSQQLQSFKPLNILQGEFRLQEEFSKYFKPWQWPAILAIVAMVIAIANQQLTQHQLVKENQALEDEKIAIFKEAFPRSKKFHSVRQRMEQALKKSGGKTDNSEFIPLLERYTQVLNSAEDIKVNGVDYSREKLSLTMQATDIQVLDQIKVNLEKNPRIAANILSSKSIDTGIEATLKLEKK